MWALLDAAYKHVGIAPTLLERDFNIPEIPTLLKEVDRIHDLQKQNVDAALGQATA